MEKYTYLLINFLTVIICFIFSFHHKIKFNRHFGAFFKSSFIVAFVFICWDIWFTEIGVWWFNDRYVTGWGIFNLPIEEVLFFFCIPFSCVFTYFCLDKFFNLQWNTFAEKLFVIFSIVVSASIGIYFSSRIYTSFTFCTNALSMLSLYFILKQSWIGKASLIYLFLMPGFLMVNGVLTGTGLDSPIVNYNPDDFLGIRILTIPIEDALYGYEMILWNIFLFKKFKIDGKDQSILVSQRP